MRARRRLRKRYNEKKCEFDRCKGEHWCTSKGHLARKNVGRSLPVYTLDKYCKPDSCIYYETKPEATPPVLLNAVATAEDLRKRHERGLMPHTNDLTAFEVQCFLTACDAQDIVDAEDDDGGGSRDSPESHIAPEGEHSAFRHWFDDETE